MKNLALLSLLILLLSGCIIEDQTYYTATLVNNSNHNIVIQYFNNGKVSEKDTLKISKDSSFQIAHGFNRGIVNHAGFGLNYSGDSAIVIFDNLRTKVHFGLQSSNSTNSYYTYSSTRNIFNYLSYNYTYIDDSKHSRSATYIYTFTEQDYLDAQ